MDTDSAYMALAGDLLEELVKEDKREVFAANKHQWFPGEDIPQNAAFDKRKAGLFKVLTYSQHHTGFSYFYPKRIVMEDGV